MPSQDDDRHLEPQLPSSDGDYAQLLDDYSHFGRPAEGEILPGYVLKISDKEVFVNVGIKSEGSVDIEEFRDSAGNLTIKVGDTIEVVADHRENSSPGFLPLSYRKAVELHAWTELERAQRDNLTISGRVLERMKGGFSVDVGVPAFMPGSQIAARPIHNLDQFIGTDIPMKVMKVNRRRGNVVVSRRLAVAEQETVRKEIVLQDLTEGSVVQGVVKNLTEYGAFIDLGGIDGLLHVSDMSFGRIQHPSEMLHVSDEITVKILKFDKERERISLGIKQLNLNPWDQIERRYVPGHRVIGRVVSVTDYGAFVELEPGVEGLIHISEMTWSRRMKHPSKVVRAGDQVEAVVLEIKCKDRRISLGIKQLEPDPWTTVAERYSIASVVEGRVRKLTEFGAFIEIEEGVDGLVHVSDLSWTKRITHPSEAVKKGQLLQAVVLHIDAVNRRLSLGVKQLQPDAWETFFRTQAVGDTVRGVVCRASTFGFFVEVAPGVEGLCHNSEIPTPAGGAADGSLPLGQEFDFKVIKLSEAEKKIGLSIRALAEDEEHNRLQDYQRQAAAATMTIDDAVKVSGGDN